MPPSLKLLLALTLAAGIFACSKTEQGSAFYRLSNDKIVYLNDIKAPIHIINLWAPWCAPCREELPLLDRFYQSKRNEPIAVIGIGVDSKDNLQNFLQTYPIRYPVWYNETVDTAALMTLFHNEAQVLPYTLIQAPRCGFYQRFTGKLSIDELQAAIDRAKVACKIGAANKNNV